MEWPDYHKTLDNLRFSEGAEKSLKETSNWILGISVGLCSLLLFKSTDFDLNKYDNATVFYKVLLIFSIVTVFISGFSKFLILNRESKLNIGLGLLQRRLYVDKKDFTEDEFFLHWNEILANWTKERNRLNFVAQFSNFASILTLLLFISSTILVITLI
ncbi:hypothetical protein [Aureibaculum conchae]|uniref:hypothetical protein n=1 Tax=Aureibaculum sp. 2308TA14-22 TaxID=3108392 RepID=UPI003397619E